MLKKLNSVTIFIKQIIQKQISSLAFLLLFINVQNLVICIKKYKIVEIPIFMDIQIFASYSYFSSKHNPLAC